MRLNSPFNLGPLKLENRIAIPPMCIPIDLQDPAIPIEMLFRASS